MNHIFANNGARSTNILIDSTRPFKEFFLGSFTVLIESICLWFLTEHAFRFFKIVLLCEVHTLDHWDVISIDWSLRKLSLHLHLINHFSGTAYLACHTFIFKPLNNWGIHFLDGRSVGGHTVYRCSILKPILVVAVKLNGEGYFRPYRGRQDDRGLTTCDTSKLSGSLLVCNWLSNPLINTSCQII